MSLLALIGSTKQRKQAQTCASSRKPPELGGGGAQSSIRLIRLLKCASSPKRVRLTKVGRLFLRFMPVLRPNRVNKTAPNRRTDVFDGINAEAQNENLFNCYKTVVHRAL